MQELINKVAAAAGISNEQAEKAIVTVQNTLKEKMPYVMHQHLDTIFNGGTMNDAFKKQFQDFANETEDGLKDLKDKAEVMMKDMSEKFKTMFEKK